MIEKGCIKSYKPIVIKQQWYMAVKTMILCFHRRYQLKKEK